MFTLKDMKSAASKSLIAAIALCTTTTAIAADDSWTFQVAPYVWAIAMNGTVQVRDRRAHVNQSFSDIMSHMNFGGMVWLDASKGKWDIFFNALYADLEDTANRGPASVKATVNYGIFGAGVAYELYKTCFAYSCSPGGLVSTLSIWPYAGFRYTLNDTTVKLSIYQYNPQRSLNENWTDPIVGARVRYDITKAWRILLAGDIGGVNTSSQYSYSATGLLGYQPQTMWTSTSWYLGYRWLDQHYVTGSGKSYYNWNMKLYGPLVGVAFAF